MLILSRAKIVRYGSFGVLIAFFLALFITLAYAESLETTVRFFGNSGPNETLSHFCISDNYASLYTNGWFRPAWTTGTWRMQTGTYYAEGNSGCMMVANLTRFEVETGPTTAGLNSNPGITLYNYDPDDTTPPTISNIAASSITTTTATITWTTNEAATSKVDYGLTTSYGSTSSSSTLVTSHSRSLSSLTCGTTYNYKVTSVDASNNSASSSNRTFTTSDCPDTTAPTISNISAGSITQTGATITWTTNESSSSRVEYGLTTSYGSQTSEADTNPRVTSHSVALSSLTCNTTYHYKVKSKDAAGNEGVSSDKTLATSACSSSTDSGSGSGTDTDTGSGSDTGTGTAPVSTGSSPPTQSNIQATNITQTGFTVTWTTNAKANHTVRYGTSSGNYTKSKSAGSGTTQASGSIE